MNSVKQSILFISYLDKSITENQLFEIFNEFPITYIKIAKNHQTKEPFGYGFVGFKSYENAEEAIIKLNYSKINNKTLRISWYNRESSNSRNITKNNIYVKKINECTTHLEFHGHFSKYGNIISAKLEEDEEGEIIGYGFVLYDNEESAKQAITEENSTLWKGKRIFVGPYIKKKSKVNAGFNTVYVKNIPKVIKIVYQKEFKEVEVSKIFSKFGEIESIFIMPVKEESVEKFKEEKKQSIMKFNYSFVTFKESNSAQESVNTQPYFKLNDRQFNIEISSLVNKLSSVEGLNKKYN